MHLSRILRFFLLPALLAGALCAQSPVITKVLNAGSQDGRLSPGTIVDVIGTNLGTDKTAGATVGTVKAPILSVDNNKWRILIPANLSPGQSAVEIGFSAPFPIRLDPYAPALFSADASGAGVVNAWGFRLNSNGALIAPGYQLSAATPAKLGDVLVLFTTGLGPYDPSNLNDTYEQPVVTVAGKPVLVFGSSMIDTSTEPEDCYGPCPTWYYQVMIALPSASAVGDQDIALSVGGVSSQTLRVPINRLPIVNAIVNGASFDPKAPLVPGALASVFGTTFGVADQLSGFPSTNFGGVSVAFNGTQAPLLAVVASAGQINLQIPTELPEAGPATMKVTTAEGVSADFTVQLASSAPGVFFLKRRNAAAQFANTAWIPMPDDLALEYGIPGNCRAAKPAPGTLCGEPARRGDAIQIYATGLGKAAPDADPAKGVLGTGVLAPADGSTLYRTVYLPSVTVGGVPAKLLFSGIAPGFAGLYQVNIEIPATAPIGDYVPISISMPNGSKDDSTTIAIKQ